MFKAIDRRCLTVLLFALISANYVHALSGNSENPTFPYPTRHCFTGNYATESDFLESMLQRLKGSEKSIDTDALEASYRRWKNTADQEVECRFFDYVVNDIPVTGFYVKPRDIDEKNLIPIIFNRGGNADRVFQTPYLFDKIAPFAQQGFMVFGSFYRGARINQTPSQHRLEDQFGGKDVQDVLKLFSIIDHYEYFKSKKIAMWGVSRGGMMAFLAAKQSERILTIIADSSPVDLYGEHQLSSRMEKVYSTWIPHYEKNKEAALKARSVTHWIDELNQTPILILQGTADRNVNPTLTLNFANLLQQKNYPYQLTMYHNAGHGLRGLENEVNSTIARWVRTQWQASNRQQQNK